MDEINFLKNIKSKYILKIITDNLQQKLLLKLVKKNRTLQNQLDITINDYKKYYEEIEIEIIPANDGYNYRKYFINIPEGYESYCHIYINDEKKEFEKDYFELNDNVQKVKIVLDKEIKSFEKLFEYCS